MMLRAYLQTLRLQNAFGLEIQPLRRAFTSISQPMTSTSRSTLSRFTHQRTTLNQSYASPLRRANNKRTFHKTSRLRDNSKPDPSNTTTQQEPLGLTARLKKLSREYGWAAVGVYLSLSVLDFPFCFLLVRVVGTDRIGQLEHFVVSNLQKVVPESLRDRWDEYRKAMKGGEEDDVNGELSERADISGWGVEAAQQRNKTEASLGTQLALAYAIHKSFIFIRVPLTAAVTPKVVKVLRSWGWNIGKRRTNR